MLFDGLFLENDDFPLWICGSLPASTRQGAGSPALASWFPSPFRQAAPVLGDWPRCHPRYYDDIDEENHDHNHDHHPIPTLSRCWIRSLGWHCHFTMAFGLRLTVGQIIFRYFGHHESEHLSNKDIPEKVNKAGVEHTVIQCFANSSRKATPPDFGLPPFLGAPVGWWMCKKNGVLRTSYFWRCHIYYRMNMFIFILCLTSNIIFWWMVSLISAI